MILTQNSWKKALIASYDAIVALDGVFLTTQGKDRKPNIMTIGWLQGGIIWGRPILTVLVRPSRYTFTLLEENPSFTVGVPTEKMKPCTVYDVGSSVDSKAIHLLEYAIMGTIYSKEIDGIKEPTVGLLSVGEEDTKGNSITLDTLDLLRKSNLNFIGNVEGKELFGGQVDVIVTDGFTGNVMLKSTEAVAKLIIDILREELMSSFRTKMGALLAKPAFGKIKKMLDPAEIGAAPLLGIDSLVFVGHGRSDARAVVSSIRAAKQAVENGLLNKLRKAISENIRES